MLKIKLFYQYFVFFITIFFLSGDPLKHTHTVLRKTLSNGMNVLVKHAASVPKVSIQLWYNVGSKDEALDEKGIAHLLEHMIFKGTEKYGESDLDAIVHKLSGSCNAFTSYDYTGYLFNVPSCQYRAIFPIMADCMQNVQFDDQMLNSEMKAVIQELKMGKDQYVSKLIEALLASIFHDHPYHYPIIGFKQDLWSVSAADLRRFYKKHYAPNNATLVVVGDVVPEEIFAQAQEAFEHIDPISGYEKKKFFHEQDIMAKSVTLFREVQLPMYLFSFVVPGLSSKQEHINELAEWVIGKGNGSRLYKKLVNELQYVTSVEVGSWALFEHGLFFICCDPVEGVTKDQIKQVIIDELDDLREHGISKDEILRAYKKTQSSFYSLLENTEEQAYAIGQNFLATKDPDYLFNCMDVGLDTLREQTSSYIVAHMRTALIHEGLLLPLPQSEKALMESLQNLSDEEDASILEARIRTTPVQPPTDAANIVVSNPSFFTYPTYDECLLDNGMKLLLSSNSTIPKISVVLSFKAQAHHDPDGKEGLYNFITSLMTEKTAHFSADELADYIESKGMSLSVYPGCLLLTCLKDDLAFGLDVIHEVLTHALFEIADIEKIRSQLISDLKNYWDDPRSFASYLVKKHIYRGHPYAKNMLGTFESLTAISRQDLLLYYKKFITPDKARLAIVGDIDKCIVKDLVANKLGQWIGQSAVEDGFPQLAVHGSATHNYQINRDQVLLCFARPSINRFDKRYDALLIFDQIFGSGMLHSMHSRLFNLRQESGLFYTIDGSFLSSVDEQGGMFLVKTIVSLDRLSEAEHSIIKVIKNGADGISEQELLEAKCAIAYGIMDNFSSNTAMARTFLYLDKYNLGKHYFNDRFLALRDITAEEIQSAVKDVLGNNELFVLKIGRL